MDLSKEQQEIIDLQNLNIKTTQENQKLFFSAILYMANFEVGNKSKDYCLNVCRQNKWLERDNIDYATCYGNCVQRHLNGFKVTSNNFFHNINNYIKIITSEDLTYDKPQL